MTQMTWKHCYNCKVSFQCRKLGSIKTFCTHLPQKTHFLAKVFRLFEDFLTWLFFHLRDFWRVSLTLSSRLGGSVFNWWLREGMRKMTSPVVALTTSWWVSSFCVKVVKCSLLLQIPSGCTFSAALTSLSWWTKKAAGGERFSWIRVSLCYSV